MRKLKNLNPKWLGVMRTDSGEGVQFDCPVCEPEKGHRIVAYFSNPIDGGPTIGGQPQVWKRSGGDGFNFGTLSIAPSLRYPCFHGWVEVGRVFTINESPIVVMGSVGNGQFGPLALSPVQAIEGCSAAIARARAMLGDGAPGDVPPARVVRSIAGAVLYVGEVAVRSFHSDEGLEPEEIARGINAWFGYLGEQPEPQKKHEILATPVQERA